MIRIKDKVAQKDVVLDLPEKEWNFVRRSMDYLTDSVLASDNVASAGTLFFFSDRLAIVTECSVMPSSL